MRSDIKHTILKGKKKQKILLTEFKSILEEEKSK